MKRYYKFAVGEPIVTHNYNTANTNKPSFEYLPYKEKGGYSHARAKGWAEHQASRKTAKRAMALYAKFHIDTEGKPTWDQMVQVGALYRADSKWPVIDFKKFLRTREGEELFMEQLKEALTKSGITYEDALSKMAETYDQAKGANHTQVMRGVYKDQLELLDKASGTSTPVDNDEYDFSLLMGNMEETMNLSLPELPEDVAQVTNYETVE